MKRFSISKAGKASASILVLSSLITADMALAQQSDNEIIVTARKQSQSLQDVPLAITALSEVEIKSAGFENIVDLSKAAPGLFIEPINSNNARVQTQPRFRGITFEATSPLQRTATVFVDGVLTSGGLQTIGFNEVERVEIIKGPQSAIFGRNTFSGAINYITSDPSEEFGGSLSVLAATRDEYRVNGSIEGGIANGLSARVSGGYNFNGGHFTNALDGQQELGEETDWNVNATALFEPAENFRLKLKGGYYGSEDGPGAVHLTSGFTEHNFCGSTTTSPNGFPGNCINETAFRGTITRPSDDQLRINSRNSDYQDFLTALYSDPRAGANGENVTSLGFDLRDMGGFGAKTEGLRLSAESSFDISENITLDLLAGYNESEFLVLSDFDSSAGGAFPLQPLLVPFSFFFSYAPGFDPATGGSFTTTGGNKVEDLSFEGRLSGNIMDDKLKWSFGANYVDVQVASVGGFYDNLDGAFFAQIFGDAGETSAETIGIFGSLDYKLTDKLTIIGEARYQEDKISEPGVNANSPSPISPATFKNFLPRVLVQYEPSEDTTVYANYSEGNLPGGFNDEVGELSATELERFLANNPGVSNTFSEETLTNYELGWKQKMFDGDVAFNLAAFYMKRSDQIFSAFDVILVDDPAANGNSPERTVAFTDNGATTNIKGFELDGTINASDSVTLQGSLAYVDAKIKSFPEGGNSGDFTAVFGPNANVEGQVAPRFPKWSGSFAINHEKDLSNGAFGNDATWYSRGDLFYTGSFFDENTNLAQTPDAVDVNVRTGLRFDNYSVEFFVTNLFDEDTVSGANNVADTSLDVRLRTVGPFNAFDFTQESVHVALRPRRQFGVRVDLDF